MLVNSGQSAQAEIAFKKAIDTNPNYADAQYQYGNALSASLSTDKDGKIIAPDGMREALEKYLQLDPMGQYADAAKGHAADHRRKHPDQLSKSGRKKGTTKKKPN